MSALHPLETRSGRRLAAAELAGRDRPAGGLRRGRQRRPAAGDGRPEDRRRRPACVAAHLNHQLRGQANPTPTRPWSSICAGGWAWPARWDGCGSIWPGRRGGHGLEAAARRARYALPPSRRPPGCGHATSSPPTRPTTRRKPILHRILRGTGIGGLAGHGPGAAAGPRHADAAAAWASAAPSCSPIWTTWASPTATTPATATCGSRGTASATSCCRGWPSSSTPAWSTPCCGWARWPARRKR